MWFSHSSEQQARTYSLSRWAWGSVVARCALQHRTPTYLSACLLVCLKCEWRTSYLRTWFPGRTSSSTSTARTLRRKRSKLREERRDHTWRVFICWVYWRGRKSTNRRPSLPSWPWFSCSALIMIKHREQNICNLHEKCAILHVHKKMEPSSSKEKPV